MQRVVGGSGRHGFPDWVAAGALSVAFMLTPIVLARAQSPDPNQVPKRTGTGKIVLPQLYTLRAAATKPPSFKEEILYGFISREPF